MPILLFTTQAAAALESPSLSAPIEKALLRSENVVFQWTAVPQADFYQLQCSTDNSFSTAITSDNIRQTSTSLLLKDNLYYWRVRAGRDNGDLGQWSSPRWFLLDSTPPPAPTLLWPQDNSYIRENTISFLWSLVDGAYDYRFLLDNDSDLSSPLQNFFTFSTSASFSLSPGRYFWRVSSRDWPRNENFSPIFTFVIDNFPPTSPSLIYPENSDNISTRTPVFSWGESVDGWGISLYRLVVDNRDNRETKNTSDNSIDLAEGLHRWKVIAIDLAGNENSSQEFTFYVDLTPPPAPANRAPENNALLPTKEATFQWSEVKDRGFPATYDLWIDDVPDFSSPTVIEGIQTTSSTREISDGHYYWKVRAVDGAGNKGGFSQTFTLTVDNTPPPAPHILWPLENVEENTFSPTFKWSSVQDVTSVRYEVQIANDAAFSSTAATITENMENKTEFLPDGTYYWRVRALDNFRAGEWSENISFKIIYRDFIIIASGKSFTVARGDSVLVGVSGTKFGSYKETVTLSASGGPPNTEFTFFGGGSPPFNSFMMIHPPSDALPGIYTITITASDRNRWTRTANIFLNVTKPPDAIIPLITPETVAVAPVSKLDVQELKITASAPMENVKIYVEKMDVTTHPHGSVYSSFKIEHENLKAVESVEIKFRVDRWWMKQNKVDPKSVTLWRFDEEEGWQKLPTAEAGEDATFAYFSATAPAISTFAITYQTGEFPVLWIVGGIGVATIIIGTLLWIRQGEELPRERPVATPAEKEEEW
ncbi:MAG: PGF-pre-PGF domain-containing protein [Candidatus Hadarchaeales archaeon]